MKKTYLRYKLVEEGQDHTTGLLLKDAEEMLQRYEATFPDIEFWIEEDYLHTTFKNY